MSNRMKVKETHKLNILNNGMALCEMALLPDGYISQEINQIWSQPHSSRFGVRVTQKKLP